MNEILRRNNVTVKGNGTQPIIFAHGFGCSQHMWQQTAAAFEADYQVILFDYVGAGDSDLQAYDSKKYSTLEGYAQDILDICLDLKLKDIILVGHSVSCMIAVIAALKAPALFRSLVFVSPSPYFFSDADYDGGLKRADIDGLFTMMETNYLGWSSMMAPLIMGTPNGRSWAKSSRKVSALPTQRSQGNLHVLHFIRITGNTSRGWQLRALHFNAPTICWRRNGSGNISGRKHRATPSSNFRQPAIAPT